MITNATTQELYRALSMVNEKYDNNIIFKNIQPKGHKIQFTLSVKDSKNAGGRRNARGKRVAAACWHVHGDFFDNLFKINPEIIIKTGLKKITKESGNWEDWKLGEYFMYSQACEC
jgi:hypothetical protein